jgi:hypothetical protein
MPFADHVDGSDRPAQALSPRRVFTTGRTTARVSPSVPGPSALSAHDGSPDGVARLMGLSPEFRGWLGYPSTGPSPQIIAL